MLDLKYSKSCHLKTVLRNVELNTESNIMSFNDVEILLFKDYAISVIYINNEISKERTIKTYKDANNLNFGGFGK